MSLPGFLKQLSPRLLIGIASVVVIPAGLWIGTRLGESSDKDVIVVDPNAPETSSEVNIAFWRAGRIALAYDCFGAGSCISSVGLLGEPGSTLLEQRHALLAEKKEKLAKLRKFEDEVAQRDGTKPSTTASTTELEKK
ncbi:hypothetical protein IWQ62_002502 [Dispira parvispora]|uniref:Uncharacterized protein n=1 Tax=Dispira parvispora TaxID=1520584 RepID=A0A9W8AVK2_9FUNG|nr:hypothetical protein IWQ62_002502 [Dispira parvispora]